WMVDNQKQVMFNDRGMNNWRDGVLLDFNTASRERTAFETLLHESGHGHHLDLANSGVPGLEGQKVVAGGTVGGLMQEIQADYRAFGTLEKAVAVVENPWHYQELSQELGSRAPAWDKLSPAEKFAFLEHAVALEPKAEMANLSDSTIEKA